MQACRGLVQLVEGGGSLPTCMIQNYIDTGRLVVKKTERAKRQAELHYAWRGGKTANLGRALAWWLAQLDSPTTRSALLSVHGSP